MPNIIVLTCDVCKIKFNRLVKDHNRNMRLGYSKVLCSRACRGKLNISTLPVITKECESCGILFSRKKTVNAKLRFCNPKCNNRSKTKRQTVCKCGNKKHGTAEACNSCKLANNRKITLGELKEKYKASDYQSITRGYARQDFSGVKKCNYCGYSKAVDICHIKAIKDFKLTATLAEVNHVDNLLALCKNHHWEFDHQMLFLENGIWVEVDID